MAATAGVTGAAATIVGAVTMPCRTVVVRVVITRRVSRPFTKERLTTRRLGVVVDCTVRTVSTVSAGAGCCAITVAPGCWVMTVSAGGAMTVWAWATGTAANSATPRAVYEMWLLIANSIAFARRM